ncbi:class E sortase [Streptomyces sp. NPDC102406]|uniref:class E sortase n=1 Tax=Streptomyces sp. NPDC102406 TaxID=3366171 RepID=UPI0038136432
MTALRPEQDGAGGFEEAVRGLHDPLNDPLPGQHPSPWFRAADAQQETEPQASGQARERPEPEPEWYDPEGYAQDWYAGAPVTPQPTTPRPSTSQPAVPRTPAPQPAAPRTPVRDDETVALRTADTRRIGAPSPRSEPEPEQGPGAGVPVATGGRAARRKAAKKGGGRRRAGEQSQEAASSSSEVSGPGQDGDGKPLTRVEARRAARAAKPTTGVIVSRVIGEVFISIGVLMLLFVTYQLWWSNIRAHNLAGNARHHLEDDWANGKGKPDTFQPGQGFAILYIPKLDVVVPIAEGISKTKVLDKGMVGHYDKDSIPTAMPDARTGNFALAGHRNTHGEPFRYVNRLQPGDPIVVETQDKYYVYKMSSLLPQTAPSNTAVIDPVPVGSGFTKPGRYITLTTCTPEFTSTYRMIVWGKMVEERPRSKGKPDALVG